MFGVTRKQIAEALADMRGGLANYRLWHLLAWQEIKQRYRRSTLGPLWLTTSMGVQIATMGLLVSFLFQHPFGKFIPYVCIGLIVWSLINGIISEGAMCFVAASGYITQIKRPLTTYLFQTIWRNVIVMGHNFIVYIIVAIIFVIVPNGSGILLLVAFPLVLLSLSWVGLFVGVLSARFRDVPIMLQSTFAVLFWLTPIVYYPEQLGNKRIIVELNPFTHMIELLRAPLLGEMPSLTNWLVVIGIVLSGWLITLLFFARFRARIAYWL